VTTMSRAQSGGDGGLSVTTLVIASCSAAVATVVVPLFWEKGTLIATAVTPIVVAVVSELLHKPVERIGAVGVWRQTSGGTAIREPGAPRPADEPSDPLPAEERVAVPATSRADPYGLYERPPRRLDRRHLRIALVTGVLGFFIAAAFVTASELALFGKSVSQGDRRTTFFGGAGSDRSHKRDGQAQPTTPSPTPGEQTATPTPTASPCEPTPTPTPSPTPGEQTPTATPTPTASPCEPSPTPTPSPTPSPQPASGQPTPAPTPPAGETPAPAP
jgi:hypothetical protein